MEMKLHGVQLEMLSTSEGLFFETINAAGSAPSSNDNKCLGMMGMEFRFLIKTKQLKQSISEALKGFQRSEKEAGFEILNS